MSAGFRRFLQVSATNWGIWLSWDEGVSWELCEREVAARNQGGGSRSGVLWLQPVIMGFTAQRGLWRHFKIFLTEGEIDFSR